MANAKYQYSGPIGSVTLRVGPGESGHEREIVFVDGQTYELPDDHEYVRTLVEKRRLVAVTEEITAADPAQSTQPDSAPKKPKKENG